MNFNTTVSYNGNLLVIRIPHEISVDFRSRKCKGTLNGAPFSGVIVRTDQNQPYIPLPNDSELQNGDLVQVQLSISKIGLPQMDVPLQLEQMLVDAGTSLDCLAPYEKQQLLSTVYEAKNTEIRIMRMKAIVECCLNKH